VCFDFAFQKSSSPSGGICILIGNEGGGDTLEEIPLSYLVFCFSKSDQGGGGGKIF